LTLAFDVIATTFVFFSETFEDSELTTAQKAYLRHQRLQRRRIMERERRKAVRAAKQRLKEARERARVAVGIYRQMSATPFNGLKTRNV
jgi:phage protein D